MALSVPIVRIAPSDLLHRTNSADALGNRWGRGSRKRNAGATRLLWVCGLACLPSGSRFGRASLPLSATGASRGPRLAADSVDNRSCSRRRGLARSLDVASAMSRAHDTDSPRVKQRAWRRQQLVRSGWVSCDSAGAEF